MNVEPWIELRRNAQGGAVAGMQYLLRARGSGINADGDFGPTTETAVRDFQAGHGLPVDGVVGPNTWPSLVVETSRGSTGEAVRGVQTFDPRFSDVPPLVVDGVFGAETESRLSLFQSMWGLESDAVVGRGTWSYLTATPGPTDVWPLVRPGATSTVNFRVRCVQFLLRAQGFAIAVDGVYGPPTAEAVRQFALSRRAVDIDGVVGNLTWPELVMTVGPGSAGDAVRAVQDVLTAQTPPPGLAADGAFGAVTEAAVKTFQHMWGLVPDGTVGPLTWRTLVIPKFD